MAEFDHIIVGSGINALVAAAMLSAKSKRVLVVERESRFGGCMHTDQITLPNFHHDVMAATFVLFITSPAHAALGEDLARHGLEFCHTPHPTAVLRPDGSSLVVTTDRTANIKTLNGTGDGRDGDQHAADVGAIEADAAFLFAVLGGELWSWPTARLLAKQAWHRGPRGLAAWVGEALRPARAWLEANYSSPLVQALWAPWVLHTGLTTESAYGAQMGKVIAFALEAAGAPVIKGGAGQAVGAFKALIEENGGELRANADVDRIIVDNGRATGVRLGDGAIVTADDVICSVTPGQLHERLLRDADAPEPDNSTETKQFRHGRGNFQLHYAIDGPIRWKSSGLEDVALIHLADGIDSVSKSSNEAERGMLPETPTICVGQPHRLDPTRCPEGKSILWLQIPDAPRLIKGDAAGKIKTTGAWDEATREAFADRIEAILASHITGFRKSVLAHKACSPADLEAMNINLVGGDPYGGSCALDQFFIWRPFSRSINNSTAIANLHHIGASTHPGPGLGGGSGFVLAKRLGA